MNYCQNALFLLSILLLFSCDCTKVDCSPPKEYFNFNIVDSVDSTDLVFGDEAIYRPEELRIYTEVESFRIYYNLVLLHDAIDGKPSLGIRCENVLNEVFYIDFGNGDVDRLELSFGTIDTECCGEYQRLNSVSFNGISVSLPVGEFESVILGK